MRGGVVSVSPDRGEGRGAEGVQCRLEGWLRRHRRRRRRRKKMRKMRRPRNHPAALLRTDNGAQ
jgi:hypothetical protein